MTTNTILIKGAATICVIDWIVSDLVLCCSPQEVKIHGNQYQPNSYSSGIICQEEDDFGYKFWKLVARTDSPE